MSFSSRLHWLYVDFNSYFASVEQQLDPRLRGRPVAVVPVETDATCAIAASYEAKAYGIKTGTPVWEAKQKCKDLVCVLAKHDHYVKFHHQLIAEINNHIPVTHVASIDEMACELMENEASPTQVERIAHSIKRGIAANVGEHIKCSIGAAPNRYLAKIATDMKKPDGFTLLEMGDLPQKLYSLKLNDLPGIGYNMEHRLRMAGIGSVETLLKLNAKQMRSLWHSIWGERVYYMLRGVEFVPEETTRSSVGHSHVMAPEWRPPERARYVARRLTMKAAARLRRMGYYAGAITVSARIERGSRVSRELHCTSAHDSTTFLHLLDDAWRDLEREGRGANFKKVSIVLHRLTEASHIEPDLFDTISSVSSARRRAEKLSYAMDKLNHKYGRDSITLGMLPHTSGYTGTKIAFTRIPDEEEFNE